jgi:hypothetical protein
MSGIRFGYRMITVLVLAGACLPRWQAEALTWHAPAPDAAPLSTGSTSPQDKREPDSGSEEPVR